ncbi:MULTISPECIES: GntR family transcriptional regulator [Pseudomonas]|uniref:GntR family transcriptional regulator n=1 Tax=Pseudomonas flexibilis TaxID=706570 RepID=A0A0B3C0U1_9PSED|nr:MULTISPECIES: GntR family transcriptional regulator [Pseudomonas]KHL69613.1 GntR family transcriptional regulator [Pseudomonas flexibilis]KHO65157.1 GntR family transcriptional regulator [Pseudomonas flexibilis]SCY42021.1 GntR family transcriptional regulator [Pseudomonas flexibilis]SIQ44285.1 transcriptional regulator, GntR family [Pseudomonas flexibilis]
MAHASLGHDERLPLYQRLKDEMLDKIADGTWLPDQAIPTEAELTRHYGVAVGTVRKAVDMLVAEGLLQRIQGRGTFLRRPNFDGSLLRFFRGGEQVPEGRILSRSLETPPASVAQALGLASGEQTLRLLRLRLIDGLPLFHEVIWLPATRFAALLDIQPEAFGNLLYPFYEQTCGQRVASAKETLTVEPAGADIAATLGLEAGNPVVVIERLALGYDRQPIEYRVSRAAADTFRYQIEIS